MLREYETEFHSTKEWFLEDGTVKVERKFKHTGGSFLKYIKLDGSYRQTWSDGSVETGEFLSDGSFKVYYSRSLTFSRVQYWEKERLYIHRISGPAIIVSTTNGTEEHYELLGVSLSQEQHSKAVKILEGTDGLPLDFRKKMLLTFLEIKH